jgi:hypothetical protein
LGRARLEAITTLTGAGIGMNGIATRNGLRPFDPYWTDEIRAPRGLWQGWGGRAAVGLTASAALIGAALVASPPAPTARTTAPAAVAPASIETVDPNLAPLFAFEAPEGARALYEARTDAATGARRDIYSLGALGGEGSAVRIEMWKRAGAATSGSLFVDVVEQAATSGAVVARVEAAKILTGADGPVEWTSLTLAGAGASRACVGFRFVARGDIGLHGLACAAEGARIDAAALNCLLDRLSLTHAGREAGFGDIVKGAGTRRPGCRAPID